MSSIRFDPDGKLIIVYGRVWGVLGSARLRLALDPAATLTLVVPGVLDSLGYNPREALEISSVTSALGEELGYDIPVVRFRAVGYEFTNFVVNAHDLPERAGIDGLLGLNFLRRFNYEVRSADGVLTFEPIPLRVTVDGPIGAPSRA